jgi:hypothetical protein
MKNQLRGLHCWLRALLITGMVLSSSSYEVFSSIPNDVKKRELALELATLFRSARKVISDHQDLINDASKGDKGLSGDKVVAQTKENFKQATGKPLSETDKSTLAGQARLALLEAIRSVMNEAQPLINQQGKDFKGFLPAVFAKRVADKFSKSMNGKMFLKLTAPAAYVRNRANRPDEWEDKVIESQFKSSNYVKGKEFAENGSHRGLAGYRLLIPEYYTESCLSCHGQPKGEADITGGKKEGGLLGELGGAISVVIYDQN